MHPLTLIKEKVQRDNQIMYGPDVDNIEVEDTGSRRPEAKRLRQETEARPGAKETTEATDAGNPQTSVPTNGLVAKSEENQIQYFSDGHYWCEIDPINSSSAEDENVPEGEIITSLRPGLNSPGTPSSSSPLTAARITTGGTRT